MSMELENNIKAALADIDSFRTADCLDTDGIDRYLDNSLEATERKTAEVHLHTCLYCLKQLNDMTALRHYEKQASVTHPSVQQSYINGAAYLEQLREFLQFTLNPWRFAAIGLATAWVIFLVSSVVLRQEDRQAAAPLLNPDSFVKVQALNESGSILREQQGVVVGPNGLIAANLTPLAGANKLQITFRDGRPPVQINNIWKDEDKNLAVMQTGSNDLKAVQTADIDRISVGTRIFAVADASKRAKGFQEGLISDYNELPGRRKEGGGRYIQVATQTTTASKGAVVDEKGNLLGFLITEEKHINLATPARDVAQLVKTGKAIPISELKNVTFSGDALNYYLRGILARDAQRWDEAIAHLQKAVQLNPRLEGAYVELGYAFYRKQNFAGEAEAYRAALKINPDNVDALYSLAWNLESNGKYPEAIGYYEKALLLEPEDMETLYQLGLAYLAQGNMAKAVEMYGRLKKLDPGNAELLRRLMR